MQALSHFLHSQCRLSDDGIRRQEDVLGPSLSSKFSAKVRTFSPLLESHQRNENAPKLAVFTKPEGAKTPFETDVVFLRQIFVNFEGEGQ